MLLAAGKKGKRFILPNAEVMIHQIMGGAQGQASDIDIHAKHILKMKSLLNILVTFQISIPGLIRRFSLQNKKPRHKYRGFNI